jgi:transposase-like protein
VRACYFQPMAPVIVCPLCQSPDVRVATVDERIAVCRCNRCPAQFTVQRLDALPLTGSTPPAPSSLKG